MCIRDRYSAFHCSNRNTLNKIFLNERICQNNRACNNYRKCHFQCLRWHRQRRTDINGNRGTGSYQSCLLYTSLQFFNRLYQGTRKTLYPHQFFLILCHGKNIAVHALWRLRFFPDTCLLYTSPGAVVGATGPSRQS